MNCREFHEKLPSLAGEGTPPILGTAAETHALGCSQCARLLAIARGEEVEGFAATPEDLLPSVLEATGGPTCPRIEERIVAYVDGELEETDRALISRHLEDCQVCREVVTTLRTLREELPLLQGAEPDVRFVVDVLERTAWAAPFGRIRRATGSAARRRILQRPRVALELAYCGAMLLYLLAGSPHDLVRDVSTRVSSWMERGIVATHDGLPELVRPLDQAAAQIRESGAHPGEELAAWPAPGTVQRVVETVGRLLRTGDLAWRTLRTAGRDLLHGNLRAIWQGFLRFRSEMRTCWSASPSGGRENRTELRTPAARTSMRDG